MSHVLAGRNNPSLDFVTKILRTFPEIRPQWLLFGEGKMYDKLTDIGVGAAPEREDVLGQLRMMENEAVSREMPTADGAQGLPTDVVNMAVDAASVATDAEFAAEAADVEAAPNMAAAPTAAPTAAPAQTPTWPSLPDDFVPMSRREPVLVKVVFFYADGHFEAYAPPRES